MTHSIVLEDIPRPAWAVMTVLGLIFFWPLGLLLLGYLFWSGKMRMGQCNRTDWKGKWQSRAGLYGSTGNQAFDDYRDETLRKLDEDAREFRGFVERLRRAKDKEEFDRFMSERNFRPAAATGGNI